MPKLEAALSELVTANRILANEGIVDSFGHVSMRHPNRPDRFLLNRVRAPELVEPADIMEFTLDGIAIDARGRQPPLESFIHGCLYQARSDVNAVVHTHSLSVIPFGVTKRPLKPLLHTCGCIGHEVPVWNCQDKFGDTLVLVDNVEKGRDLANLLGSRPTALMRGHGAVIVGRDVRLAVYIAYYLEVSAKLQMQAMAMGEVTYLTPGEVDLIIAKAGPFSTDRTWENWCRRAGCKIIDRGHEAAR
jgi:ribulose-5-phosphate 4-epimerase/fuculose-1-phosphate aldolase